MNLDRISWLCHRAAVRQMLQRKAAGMRVVITPAGPLALESETYRV